MFLSLLQIRTSWKVPSAEMLWSLDMQQTVFDSKIESLLLYEHYINKHCRIKTTSPKY